MRSLILFMVFLVLAVLSLTMPSIGVLTWAWIAIMSPHRLTWDFTYTLQLNLVIVVITFIAWIVAREPKRLPMNSATVMIILFMAGGLAVILGLTFLGWFTLPFGIIVYLFELGLVATLQAFIFATLAAIYIGGAVSHH